DEHRAVPVERELDHRARSPVHARSALARDALELVRGQQGRRARGAPQGARQHGPSGRLCAHGNAVHVARDPALLGLRRHLESLPGRVRVRPDAAAGLELELRRQRPRPLVPAVPLALPRLVRGLGDRNAEHDHLRARIRLRALPRGARCAAATRQAVRVPQRRAAAGHRARALARRDPRRCARHRDRLLVPRPGLPDLPGDHERRLLRDPGNLPLHHRRRPRRELHRRHRVRPDRSAHADRDGRRPDVSATVVREPAVEPKQIGVAHEAFHFAVRNRKLVVGTSITLAMLLFALVGPLFARHPALEYGGRLSLAPTTSGGYWFGTTLLGQDVYAQFVNGLRLAFTVGALGGGIAACIGMLVGFTAGYRSGIVDEILNMLTNVVLVIPTFALLLVIAAYLKVRGVMTESVFIGVTSWPWAARAIRAQTFSLVSRD